MRRRRTGPQVRGAEIKALIAPGALKRLWTPTGIADRPTIVFWRVRLVTTLIRLLALVLFPIAVAAMLVMDRPVLSAPVMLILAASLASTALLEVAGIWRALWPGRWTGWRREPIWRHDRPVRFWGHTALHASIGAALPGAAAVFLVYMTTWVERS
jgi:hypothetical protein